MSSAIAYQLLQGFDVWLRPSRNDAIRVDLRPESVTLSFMGLLVAYILHVVVSDLDVREVDTVLERRVIPIEILHPYVDLWVYMPYLTIVALSPPRK